MSSSLTPAEVSRNLADELVMQARLAKIERRDRSKGSILDNRELHKITDPILVDKSSEATRRVQGRRVGRAHTVLQEDAESVLNALRQDGSGFIIEGTFDLEEQLWKTKSADPESMQKRRYENEDLHKFRESLTAEQKQQFKAGTIQMVHDLALQYRQEMSNLKRDLDRQGIFHPSANAHRVHCMYLMKLTKG